MNENKGSILSDNTKQKNPNRVYLCEISANARKLQKAMIDNAAKKGDIGHAIYLEAQPLNFFIRKIYKLEDVELKTFKQWKEEGATIRKGAKAFIFWGQPKKRRDKKKSKKEIEENLSENDKEEFFPMCYLFTQEQIFRKEVEDKIIENLQSADSKQELENFVL